MRADGRWCIASRRQVVGAQRGGGGYFFRAQAHSGALQPAPQTTKTNTCCACRARSMRHGGGLLAAGPHTAGKLVGVSTPNLVCSSLWPRTACLPADELSFRVTQCQSGSALGAPGRHTGIFCLCSAVSTCCLVVCWQRVLAGVGFVCGCVRACMFAVQHTA